MKEENANIERRKRWIETRIKRKYERGTEEEIHPSLDFLAASFSNLHL